MGHPVVVRHWSSSCLLGHCEEAFSNKKVRKIKEWLDETEEIKLVASNGTPFPYGLG